MNTLTPEQDLKIHILGNTGVNSLSVNIELFDPELAKRIIPTENRRFGLQGYLNYIEKAVGEFGVGRAQSLILL